MAQPWYIQGKNRVLETLGLQQPDKPAWQHAIAPALGLGATAGLYALLRKQRISPDKILGALQRSSKGRMAIIASSQKGAIPGTHPGLPDWLSRILIKATRGADDVIMHKPTPEELATIPERWGKMMSGSRAKDPRVRKVRGAVMNSANPTYSQFYQGDAEVGHDIRRTHRLRDKLREAKLLHRYMPGVGPKPYGTVKKYLRSAIDEPVEAQLANLQAQLQKAHPQGYVVKPRHAGATGDIIHNEHNLIDLARGNNQKSKWVQDMIQNPDAYVVQERIPIATEARLPLIGRQYLPGSSRLPAEMRFHVIGGRIIPDAIIPRYPGAGVFNPFRRMREKRELIRQLQPEIDKLPEVYRRDLMYGADAVRTPENKWRIIETNPGEHSGFMQPDITHIPTTLPHAIYKAVTGRHSPVAAGTKALLGGGALAGTAVAAQELPPFQR